MKTSLKKLTALLTLLLALSLAACGGADDDDDTDLTDFIPMTVEELTGGWVDDDGNQLVIDPDTGTYDYRTWYGRVGFGFVRGRGRPTHDRIRRILLRLRG